MIDRSHADLYLQRMRYFLNLIGDPDKDFRYIHIAGTSGKGTVTNMLHEILYAAGKKVGSFTSPYVVTSIEKIKVGQYYISPNEFSDIVDYLKPFIDKAYVSGLYGRPSYFEIFFAIALLYFKKMKCEWVVLEVGLGGRFDATNVITTPLVTAITNIDFDHTEILGKTLTKIAYDKAGIIKKGSVFFTTEKRKNILRIFVQICLEKKVSISILPKQSEYHESNKSLATAIARHISIKEEHISKGLNHSRMMCRFETVQNNPTVILDGAHNRAKISSTVANLERLKFEKVILIIGIANNKDHISILAQIIPKVDIIIFTRFSNRDRKCAHPKELMEKSKKFYKRTSKSQVFLDANDAMDHALGCAGKKDVILVAGSFFLAGAAEKVASRRRNFVQPASFFQKRAIIWRIWQI
jgi:dihydrofolate synthase/folylpolyglutamate synthase